MDKAKLIAALLAAAVLSGCGGFASIAPGDSEVAVGEKVGRPTTVWKNPDGSEIWQYPQGYYATETFVITMGSDRRVKEIHQALSDPYFSKIYVGMSKDDVYRMLGRPREVWNFPARDEETWTWRYRDTNYMFFNVMFDRSAGTVRNTQRLQEILFLDGGRGRM
jgi:outer membrane protein assembly factor BamE (lipoprotein component of BamABCDE complex)